MDRESVTILDSDEFHNFQAFSISTKPDMTLVLINEDDQFEESEEKDAKKSSDYQASFTLFKVFVGSGILALPASFAHVGFLLGAIGIFLAGLLTYYCMDLLMQVTHDMKANSTLNLQILADKIVGRWGKISVQISLVIMQVGVGIAIMLFSTQFLNHLTCTFNLTDLCDNKLFMASFALVVVVPLSFITNLHYFYIPSLMATFFIFLNIIVQVAFNFNLMASQKASDIFERMGEFNLANLPLFFGVATYAFEGIGVVFNVRSSMQKPQNFPRILKIQMIIIAFLYCFFPGTSELAFGQDVPGIILFSLPSNNYFYLFTQILYVISALLGFPVQLFPVLNIIENSLGIHKSSPDEQESTRHKFYKIGIRLALVAFMLFVALVAKSFNLFINLMGSGVFTYLGYLLPIIIYQTYFRGRIPKFNFIINSASFVIGSFLGILGIIVSVQAIIDYD